MQNRENVGCCDPKGTIKQEYPGMEAPKVGDILQCRDDQIPSEIQRSKSNLS